MVALINHLLTYNSVLQ